VGVNLVKTFEGGQFLQGGLCLYNPEAFFTAMEFSYPMLISPIMLIPEAIPFASVQQAYLKAASTMAMRQGPRLTARMMTMEQVIPIEKQDYTPRSVLIAPVRVFDFFASASSPFSRGLIFFACLQPIIFQTKRSKASTCPSKYSSTFIKQQFQRMETSKCQAPYECDAELLRSPERILSCPVLSAPTHDLLPMILSLSPFANAR
jgi:hypothetical protein